MKKARVVGGLAATLGALVLLTAWATPVRAQSTFQPSFDVDGRLGFAVPLFGIGKLEDIGLAADLGGAYWFAPRFAARADWSLEALRGSSIPGAQRYRGLNLWHYTVGLETSLTPPIQGNVKFTVNGGLGATTLDFSGSGPTHTYFSLTGGARLLFPISQQMDLFGGAQLNLALSNGADTFQRLADVTIPGGEVLGTSSVWSMPIWGGVRVHFP